MKQDQENAALVSKILAGARWATMLRLSAQLISWVSTIIVVRFISTTDYGLNAMLETPLELLFLLSTFGLDTAIVQSKHLEKEELRSTFGWLLMVNVLLFLAYFFGGTLIAAYFNEPRLDFLAKVLSFVFLMAPFRVIPNALLERDLKFKLKATVEFVVSVITIITTLVLAVLGAGIWALITGMLLSRLLLISILMVLQPWFITPSFRFYSVRGMIAFGGTMALASAIAITSNMFPVLIAGPGLGPEMLGIFVVALQFAVLPLSKIMPVINTIIFPAFSKFQGQPLAITRYLEKSLSIAALAILPIMVGTACIAEDFVLTILGEKWSMAIVPLAILSLAMPFRGVTYFIRQVMAGIGHADLTLKSTILNSVLFFSTVFFGARYGVMGVVLAVFVTEPVIALATVQMSKRAIDTSILKIARQLAPAVISVAIMAAGVFSAKYLFGDIQGLTQLFIEVGIGAITYLMVLRVFFADVLTGALRLLKA